MTRAFICSMLGSMTIALVACYSTDSKVDHYDLVVKAGRVMDPESGLDAIRNIGIRDGRIIMISEDTLDGGKVIDAAGLVVAPGFIDLHTHQFNLQQSQELYEVKARDGVTTAFELEIGTADVTKWYDEREGGQRINYGVSIGHTPVRVVVMADSGQVLPSGPGGSEVASSQQITEMERRIEEGLEQGALAVGFGLVYTPAATSAEFEALLRIAANHNAIAFVHLRGTSSWNPDPELTGLREAIASVATTGTSLHVAHANSSAGPFLEEFLRTIEQTRSSGQDITTEAYPYEAGMTYIESAAFDNWESLEEDRFSILEWAQTGERLTRDTFASYRARGGLVIMHARDEELTRTVLENPITMIASDGFIENGRGHPRASGTFSKVLGKYVREEHRLTLMEALRRMTIEPARRLEKRVWVMKSKGRLSVGADADITIFDAATVIDRSTYTNPTLPSAGIMYVLVNGELVVEGGELVSHARPGRSIRVQ